MLENWNVFMQSEKATDWDLPRENSSSWRNRKVRLMEIQASRWLPHRTSHLRSPLMSPRPISRYFSN